MAVKIENYFKDAAFEYEQIENDIRSKMPQGLSDEILAFVQVKTNEAMQNIWNIFQSRNNQLQQAQDSIPEEYTSQDVQAYYQSFFRITNPSYIAADIKRVLAFKELEQDYYDFINTMANGEYGELFHRYQYPSSFFDGMRRGITLDIQKLAESLKEYTDSIGQHAIVVDSVKSDQAGKSLIKGGASLLGLMIGVPFAGAGVGALMGDNSEERINKSIQKVFKSWDLFNARIHTFINELEIQYKFAMIAIYGSTLLQVHHQFKNLNVQFDELQLMKPAYSLTLTNTEKEKTREWIVKTTNGIQNLLKLKKYRQAIQVAAKFFTIVKNNPVMARTVINDQQSSMFIAHLFYYTAYQEALLEEYRNGHLDSFYQTSNYLFQEMFILIGEQDMQKIGFSSPSKLIIRMIKESVRRNQIGDLVIFHDHMGRVIDRIEKQHFYEGENTSNNLTKDMRGLYAARLFLMDHLHPSVKQENPLSKRDWKALIINDKELNQPDAFTTFLKKKYWLAAVWPWGNAPFTWIGAHKKALSGVVISIGLLTGAYFNSEEIYQFAKDKIGFGQEQTQASTDETTNKESISYHITTEFANVRSAPGLSSNVLFVATMEDSLKFLDQQSIDEENRVWYKVENQHGEIGWISSNIVAERNS
ncbi:SH3 domain-containing protein [Gracilibacillus oryzae]|uniref:SH3 domain-containing protein n=1 Tax=Gracilibacillus oryzae TaxID=1672701 RepID=A0A7C8GWF0_9BACI|nr:SH3 domain-containing protein [Gracilibacillus oryzae]KAB8139473.1 SH3 domain-containing protein [Gracilibacillus oryzae]